MIGTCVATVDGHLAPVKSVCWIDKGESPLSPPIRVIFNFIICLVVCFFNKYV